MPDPVLYHEWRGLIFGDDGETATAYPWTSANGVEDLAMSGGLLPGGALDGAGVAPLRADASSWLSIVDIYGTDEAAYITQRDALKAATWRNTDPMLEEPYDIYVGTEEPVTRFARVVNRSIPTDENSLVRRYAVAQIVFESSDPLTYTAVQDVELDPTDTHTFTCAGWAPSERWSATIVGPVTNPQVRSSIDSSAIVRYNGTVPEGSTLLLELGPRSLVCTLDGDNVYGSMDGGIGSNRIAQWFPIVPGEQTISYFAAGGTGTCTFAWREAKP